MTTTHDFLVLLNKIKMEELGDKGHPFTMPQLNYFINPKRNTRNYKTFTIPKKTGGERVISAPTKMLKSMLTYTNCILQAFYEAPDCVTGFVPLKSVVDNAERHVGMNYVFNADIKDFFPSIPQARVWGALKSVPFNFHEAIASAIAGLCCIEEVYQSDEDGKWKARYYLPQGSPCSPILTNIVCHNLDWKLSGLAKRFHLRYSRYADDITFSSNHNVYKEGGEFISEFRRIITEQHFVINEQKTRLQKRGQRQEVTGLIVSDRVNVTREYVRDLDNLLYIWEKYGYDAAFVKFLSHYTPKHNYGKGVPNMDLVVSGKLMYLRMVKGEDSTVWRNLQKRFNRLTNKNIASKQSDIVYLHSYSIAEFENAIGAKIALWTNPYAEDKALLDYSEKIMPQDGFGPYPMFTLNGHLYNVSISKYVRTRLNNIFENGATEEAVEKFKKKYRICYCTYDIDAGSYPQPITKTDDSAKKIYFWVLTRPHIRKRSSREPIPNIDVLFSMYSIDKESHEQDATPETENSHYSTDEILSKLVESGFDLNLLELWERTKTNN